MAGAKIHRWTHRAEEGLGAVGFANGRILVAYHGRPGGEGRCEDAALVIELPGDAYLLAVADGMGGGPRAADASAAIIDALAARATELAEDSDSRIQVLDAIEEADQQIRSWGVGAGSTVVVAELDGTSYRSYHVGDSEALVTGQRGLLKWQTISHSPVGYAQASGLLESQDAMVHEERHLVDSMLGMEGMRVDVGERRNFDARDTLLLATDGLFDNLSVPEIVEITRKGRLELAARRLSDLSFERMRGDDNAPMGKPDDLAFILYRPRRIAPPKDTP